MKPLRPLVARAALAVFALVAASSALAQGTVLRIVPHSNLAILDPIWTTAYMSRNHGYMIYDTLFGTDENAKIKPQMVESWTVSDDNRLWTFKLRKGLEFHDGKPVTGVPSCHRSPSRSVIVHVSLSADTSYLSIICGLIWPAASVANSVS